MLQASSGPWVRRGINLELSSITYLEWSSIIEENMNAYSENYLL
jgi:hypothetical protein